jgi:rhodanese-related sulfurtransferase
MCGSGKRSLTAMLMLKSLGYKNVKSLNGGLNAWVTEGCPTE